MPALTRSDIGKLICAHTGQRISLRTDEIQQHFDFAHALLAQLEATAGVSTLPSTPLPGSAQLESAAEKFYAIRKEYDEYMSDSFAQQIGVSFADWKLRYKVKTEPVASSPSSALQPVQAVPDGRYDELIYAVARKFPGETRHETALRYIRQAEANAHSGSPAAAGAAPGESGQ